MKRIGIIGSGIVAQTLAKGMLGIGHQVTMGTRSPEKLDDFAKENSIEVSDFNGACSNAELVVLAVKGTVAEDALRLIDDSHLSGKTVIDVTNPISNDAPENGVLKFFTDINYSLMERLQKQVSGAHFVKSFSCVGSAYMVNPDFNGSKPTMFMCGNDEGAKDEVKAILNDFGWDIEDMGGAEAARAIEPLCMLWCIPGFRENRWSHAFKLLRE